MQVIPTFGIRFPIPTPATKGYGDPTEQHKMCVEDLQQGEVKQQNEVEVPFLEWKGSSKGRSPLTIDWDTLEIPVV